MKEVADDDPRLVKDSCNHNYLGYYQNLFDSVGYKIVFNLGGKNGD